MLFNSTTFFIFAAVFFFFWRIVKSRPTTRWMYLVSMSFVFYGWWDWRFISLIVFSGLIDFFAAHGMERWPRYRRIFLICSLIGNLGSLAAFKYASFLAESLESFAASFGLTLDLQAGLPDMFLILPVGISFYTFQSMSYTIDVYRGKLKPTSSIWHFFAYLSLFPQLVAGPIVRAADMLPQLLVHRDPTEEERWEGLRLIVYGFFKKIVIADNLALYVNVAFGQTTPLDSAIHWWVIVTAFAFQIYCDFSGYSDIARGLTKWMGYDLPLNFRHPYTATSLRDFWQRWHITLSTWFRDYVYIPLGGSRCGEVRNHLNMWITMVLSGLWHGAAWTFILWGAVHAAWLSLERLTGWPDKVKALPLGRWIAALLVIIQVWVAWVFFRATSWVQALQIIRIMFNPFSTEFNPGIGIDGLPFLAVVILRELYVFLKLDQFRQQMLPPTWNRWLDVVTIAGVMVACIYLRGPGATFIYFQF